MHFDMEDHVAFLFPTPQFKSCPVPQKFKAVQSSNFQAPAGITTASGVHTSWTSGIRYYFLMHKCHCRWDTGGGLYQVCSTWSYPFRISIWMNSTPEFGSPVLISNLPLFIPRNQKGWTLGGCCHFWSPLWQPSLLLFCFLFPCYTVTLSFGYQSLHLKKWVTSLENID